MRGHLSFPSRIVGEIEARGHSSTMEKNTLSIWRKWEPERSRVGAEMLFEITGHTGLQSKSVVRKREANSINQAVKCRAKRQRLILYTRTLRFRGRGLRQAG